MPVASIRELKQATRRQQGKAAISALRELVVSGDPLREGGVECKETHTEAQDNRIERH